MGAKFLIVIQDSIDEEKNCCPSLKTAVKFFHDTIGFTQEETLYLKTEDIKIIDAMFHPERHTHIHYLRNGQKNLNLYGKLRQLAEKQ